MKWAFQMLWLALLPMYVSLSIFPQVFSLILLTCPRHSLPHFTEREAEAPRGTVSPDPQTRTISALEGREVGRSWLLGRVHPGNGKLRVAYGWITRSQH